MCATKGARFDAGQNSSPPPHLRSRRPNSELEKLLAPLTDGRRLLDSCASWLMSSITAVPAATEVLHALGWQQADPPLFAGVFGCDSGHGAKPQPGMLLAAAAATGVEPSRCAMVGDAAGDLTAARSAGFAAAILVGRREARKSAAWKALISALLVVPCLSACARCSWTSISLLSSWTSAFRPPARPSALRSW